MNSRRAGENTLLVSFCNVRGRRRSVAAIDLRSGEVRWIDLQKRVRGARGLCFWNDLVCVAHQPGPRETPAGLVFLDPMQGFVPVGDVSLPHLGVHSVCSRDEVLYLTMSEEDAIYRATLERGRWSTARHWTLPGSSGQEDQHHVNGIDFVDGDLWVSGLGRRKETGGWPSSGGFIWNTDQERFVLEGLRQPHSLLADAGTVWTCETAGSALMSSTGDTLTLAGDLRIRGLAMGSRYLYAGASKRRIGSKSQGTFEGYRGACTIYRFERSVREPEVLIDLSDRNDEIYELLLL